MSLDIEIVCYKAVKIAYSFTRKFVIALLNTAIQK